MTKRTTVPTWTLLLLTGISSLAGCEDNSSVGHVSGVVTLDGQPLPEAFVHFQPQAEGAPSLSKTDRDGRYTLRYSRTAAGALVGTHVVRITTFQVGDLDADPPRARSPERVPPEYNTQSRLTAVVQPGSNEIPFDLQSSGPVAQPDSLHRVIP